MAEPAGEPPDGGITTAVATSTSTTTPAGGVVEAATSRSPLLELPAELRNRIYEYAVAERRKIVVDNGVSEPPLTLVCKQVRQESIPIYYTNNKFSTKLKDWSGSTHMNLGRKNSMIHTTYGVHIPNMYGPKKRTPCWPELLKWLECRYFQKDGLFITSPPKDLSHKCPPDAFVVGGMFEMVGALKGQPWDTVLEQLEQQHQILIRLDPRWA
jgi:hypothetical protein